MTLCRAWQTDQEHTFSTNPSRELKIAQRGCAYTSSRSYEEHCAILVNDECFLDDIGINFIKTTSIFVATQIL